MYGEENKKKSRKQLALTAEFRQQFSEQEEHQNDLSYKQSLFKGKEIHLAMPMLRNT